MTEESDLSDTTESDVTRISESLGDEENRKFLLTDANYQKLRNLQQRIYLATELSPSMRKLINAVITDEALDNLSHQLIQQLEVIN